MTQENNVIIKVTLVKCFTLSSNSVSAGRTVAEGLQAHTETLDSGEANVSGQPSS